MATLAGRHVGVNRRVGLANRRWETAVMASCTLATHRHCSVKARWRPGRKTAAVASVAIRDRHTTQALIRNVGGWPAIGGWESTAVTGGALIRYGHLGVIELGRPPSCDAVAAKAIGRA
jgi:hypothetical protein